jgi:hypothetical protein
MRGGLIRAIILPGSQGISKDDILPMSHPVAGDTSNTLQIVRTLDALNAARIFHTSEVIDRTLGRTLSSLESIHIVDSTEARFARFCMALLRDDHLPVDPSSGVLDQTVESNTAAHERMAEFVIVAHRDAMTHEPFNIDLPLCLLSKMRIWFIIFGSAKTTIKFDGNTSNIDTDEEGGYSITHHTIPAKRDTPVQFEFGTKFKLNLRPQTKHNSDWTDRLGDGASITSGIVLELGTSNPSKLTDTTWVGAKGAHHAHISEMVRHHAVAAETRLIQYRSKDKLVNLVDNTFDNTDILIFPVDDSVSEPQTAAALESLDHICAFGNVPRFLAGALFTAQDNPLVFCSPTISQFEAEQFDANVIAKGTHMILSDESRDPAWRLARIVTELYPRQQPDLINPPHTDLSIPDHDALVVIGAWRELTRALGAVTALDVTRKIIANPSLATQLQSNASALFHVALLHGLDTRDTTWAMQIESLAVNFISPARTRNKQTPDSTLFIFALQVCLDFLSGKGRDDTLHDAMRYAVEVATNDATTRPAFQIAAEDEDDADEDDEEFTDAPAPFETYGPLTPPFYVYPVRAAREVLAYGSVAPSDADEAWTMANYEFATQYDFLVLNPVGAAHWVLHIAMALTAITDEETLVRDFPVFKDIAKHLETTKTTPSSEWLPEGKRRKVTAGRKTLWTSTEPTRGVFEPALYHLEILKL